MAVSWTSASRRKLHGFRHPHKLDPEDQSPGLKNAWAILRSGSEVFGSSGKNGQHYSVSGAKKHTAIAKSVLKEMLSEAPPASLDPVREIYRAELVMQPTSGKTWAQWDEWALARALVALWIRVEGVPFVLELLHRALLFDVNGTHRGDSVELVFGDAKHIAEKRTEADALSEHMGPLLLTRILTPLWWAVRAHFSILGDDEFADARSACKPYLKGVPKGIGGWHRRSALLMAVSRDLELTGSCLRSLRPRWKEDTTVGGSPMMLVAAPDAATAMSLLGDSPVKAGLHALDLVEAFDVEAGPIIEAIIEFQSQYSALKYLSHERAALKVIAKAGGPSSGGTPKKKKRAKITAPKKATKKKLRRFELSDGSANKFWEVAVDGASHTVRYGRIGTEGRDQTKTFADRDEALESAKKLIRQKTKKGYQEV